MQKIILEKEDTMLRNTLAQVQGLYNSWDSFKRDLERSSGHFLPVDWWLRVKPKKPLPWTHLDMQDSMVGLSRITNEVW
jgi:hypothetical protein